MTDEHHGDPGELIDLEEGMLTPAGGVELRFERAELIAARLQGG